MKYEKGSFATIPNMSAIKGQNPILQVIYMWLCFHVDKKGKCFPSQSTIAIECGVSIASINRYILELENIGLIKREVRNVKGSKEKDTTIYSLLGTLTQRVGTLTQRVQVLSHREGGTLTQRERTKLNELNSLELNKEKEKSHFESKEEIVSTTGEGEDLPKPPSPTEPKKMTSAMFEEFWLLYPKKKEKALCKPAYLKLDSSLHELILSATEEYKKSLIEANTEKKFILYPIRWIKRKRWEDEEENIPLDPQKYYELNGVAKFRKKFLPTLGRKEIHRLETEYMFGGKATVI